LSDVTVTVVARNFADFVNRVAYRGERFRLVRGGRAVAELTPVPAARRLGDLPDLLAEIPQLGPDAEAFRRDVDGARSEISVGRR
jgi:antitoxin (DNA-binding transcriptional repressor) of toxin-antitoxin stability system